MRRPTHRGFSQREGMKDEGQEDSDVFPGIFLFLRQNLEIDYAYISFDENRVLLFVS
jgi:hypothetical protein